MADILIQPAVPSLFTHTESASSLILDSPTADSNNSTTIHHSRASTNNATNNNNNNNNNNNSSSNGTSISANNKYIGHVSRLRSVFTQYALTINDLKPGEHRSRFSNHHHHHHQGPVSPSRGIADGADESSPPPLLTTAIPSIERSRSLSNPRLLDTSTVISSMRSGNSSLSIGEQQQQQQPPPPQSATNDDHTVRFRKAKEMFQTLEEAHRTSLPSSNKIQINNHNGRQNIETSTTTTTFVSSDENYDENPSLDFMHDRQKILVPLTNTEHIPDLIIDHRQQTDQHMFNTNRTRDIPVQYVDDDHVSGSSPPPPPSISPSSHSDRSFTSIPIHRAVPPPPIVPIEDVSYASVNRKQQHQDQHYDFPKESIVDFPADAIEQMKKRQHEEIDSTTKTKPSNEEMANRIVASILPSNILKRMDHLNTIFIKPTTIDRPLPKLSFQEELSAATTTNEDESKQTLDNEQPPKWIDNPMLNDAEHRSPSSSPLFYEKPGLSEIDDEDEDGFGHMLSPNGTRRVKFSNAPIRVYPTYSPSEYNRRNDDIDPFSASAEYELEKRIEKMHVFNVELEKGPDGLGISVLGMGVGADSGLEKLGIFVKSLNPQGVIARDGRIKVGDQIIEVDGQSLVGVTHTFATGVLKATSGLVKFLIGREKDPENSEVFRLILQSLQMDQERNEMARALQHHHDTYVERHGHDDDGFSNMELNNGTETNENQTKTNYDHDELAKEHEKNYEQMWSLSQKMQNGHVHSEDESFQNPSDPTAHERELTEQLAILKERYESLQATLESVEKEKEYYQQLHQQSQQELEHIEEKYLKAKKLIKESQDRETELRQQHVEQMEINEQQRRRLAELTKKTEELEKAMAASTPNLDRFANNNTGSLQLSRIAKLPSNSSENVGFRPPDLPERVPIRSRTSSGQPLISPERPPSRNTPATSSVRLPSTSLDKVFMRSQPPPVETSEQQQQPWQLRSTVTTSSNKMAGHLDFEIDRSPLLNHSIQMDKSQVAKTRPRNLPSKRLSNPLLDEASAHNGNEQHPPIVSDVNKSYMPKIPSLESTNETTKVTSTSSNRKEKDNSSDDFIEIKDWTSDQCIQWLTSQEMTSLIPLFLNRNIDGEKLLMLDSTKMKVMGIKSSKERDHLKSKLKELKHAELDRIRERLLTQQQHSSPFHHSIHTGNRLRSSSMTKLKDRKLFGGSGGK